MTQKLIQQIGKLNKMQNSRNFYKNKGKPKQDFNPTLLINVKPVCGRLCSMQRLEVNTIFWIRNLNDSLMALRQWQDLY